MTRTKPHWSRLAPALALALLLAGCGADGEPEAPERLAATPAASPLPSAPVPSR